jgi:hypothetical protein
LSQEDIKHPNISVTSNETKVVVRSLLTKKSPGKDGFITEFYQTFKEELTPMLLKLFCKTEKEGTPPNSFYEASITLMPKLDKTQQQKYLRPFS